MKWHLKISWIKINLIGIQELWKGKKKKHMKKYKNIGCD